jgi:chromosome segregation protein
VLDAWVVPAAGSIDKLTPKQAGELLFLLADALPDAPGAALDGEIGRLSDFARAAGDIAAPVAKLLSRYAVVESSASVPQLAGSLPAGFAVVTRSGDALLQNGILFLGEGLGGREEMKKLSLEADAAISEAKETIRVIDNRLADLRDDSKRVEREFQNAEKESQKLSLRNVERTSEITSLEKEMQFHEQALEAWGAAVAELDAQRTNLDAEKQQAQQALDSEQQAFQGKKQDLDRKEILLNEMLETRRQRQALLQDLRMKLNDRKNDNRSIDDNVTYREKEIERAEQQAESRRTERTRLDAEITARMAEFEASRGGGEELAREVESAQKELAARQEKLNEHERAIKQYESDIDDMDQAAADAREQIQQIQIRRARTEAQLEEQRRVFSEEFPGTDEAAALEEAADVQPGERAEYKRYRKELEDMGPVNMLAIGEFDDEKQRYDLLMSQLEDLQEVRVTLLDMVNEYDNRSRNQFLETFNAINEKFKETFQEIFATGDAEIVLTNPADPLETGVEIHVQMPGKRMRNIRLLSGGEKALTALTLIFAILKVKPSPFYLLDEVDAGLDESNVAKFKSMLMTYSKQAQFMVITHNKGTLIGADHYYGITMDSTEGYTKVLSVSLEQ